MQDLAMFANTLAAATLLLDNSRRMQEAKRTDTLDHDCCMRFAKELCTVKVCGPRRSGHSHVAGQLFLHYFKEEAWVVAPRMEMLPEVVRAACRKNSSTMGGLERHRGMANISAVIVDTASLFSQHDIERIYNDFCPYIGTNAKKGEPFFFVFLE